MEQKALTQKEDPIYQMLTRYKSAIASVLPKHITPERMLRIAYQVIHRTPKLRNCSQASLINGILEISMLGLDIGRTAHLLPFGNEAIVVPDYKGLIDLAHRSGQINSLSFKAVYQNDNFEYEEGTSRYIKHKPTEDERGPLRAAYAICNYKHGGLDFELIFREDAMAVKARSPAKSSGDSPWNKSDQEWTMWCKTAVRRLAKRIPQSPELQRAVELEDLIEAGLKQNLNHIVDAEIEAPPPTVPEKITTGDPKEKIKEKLNDLKQKGQIRNEVDDIRSEFINLKQKGFRPWVLGNSDIKTFPPKIQAEIEAKWADFRAKGYSEYQEPYPYPKIEAGPWHKEEEKPPNIPDPESSQGQGEMLEAKPIATTNPEEETQSEPDLKAEAVQRALEAKRMEAEETIFCPDHEGNVKSSLCKDCLLRNRCDPYKEWQHEKQRE
uniref:Putative DNA recombination protein n=1 Tax=viral metagenome TaxID=1070528 RepID=A0A6M3JKH4_9ZZZZ